MRTGQIVRHALKMVVLSLCAASAHASGLRVTSARIAASPQQIVIDLMNDGPRPVTAYSIEVTVINHGTVVSHFGYGDDLLQVVVNSRAAGETNSWAGAILPSVTFQKSLPQNFPNLTLPDTTVRAQVAAVIYADGSSDGTDRDQIQQMRDERQRQAKSAEVVSSILSEHANDSDISLRFRAIRQALQPLAAPIEVQTTDSSKSTTSQGPANSFAGVVLTNLKIFQSSPDPQKALDAYTAYFTKSQEIRVALIAEVKQGIR